MKSFIILLLACVSVCGAETDIRVVSIAQTNAENATAFTKDVFTRDGQTNLIRTIWIESQMVVGRIHRFYHAGQCVDNFVVMSPAGSTFNTEASPYCMSLEFSPSGDIRSARIGDKDGVLLDQFGYTNGIFAPVEGPLNPLRHMKPKFASDEDSLKRKKH